MAPSGISANVERLGGVDLTMVNWDFAESGSTYFMDVTSMTNATTGDDGMFIMCLNYFCV